MPSARKILRYEYSLALGAHSEAGRSDSLKHSLHCAAELDVRSGADDSNYINRTYCILRD